MIFSEPLCIEEQRLRAANRGEADWQRWGTYLPERQWGTVREDYSSDGDSWSHFPYEMAQYRAYRWGEDGIFGWTDSECRLTFATALWNHKDSMLKERLFGLTNHEGNHGEDVKELYYYLDGTPTHSYARALYRYPQSAFPYEELRAENKRRGVHDREYELVDTGAFDGNRFFDVSIEYAKQDEHDLGIRITIVNRGDAAARLTLLPTLTFRNVWSWPSLEARVDPLPRIRKNADGCPEADHPALGRYVLTPAGPLRPAHVLFTENETNLSLINEGTSSAHTHTKDAFARYVIHGEHEGVITACEGTRCSLIYELELTGGEEQVVYLSFNQVREGESAAAPQLDDLISLFEKRVEEADEFYRKVIPNTVTKEEARIARLAYAGMLWSKQFYFFAADTWLNDEDQCTSSTPARLKRTSNWPHLFCKDVLAMPDSWEYPWFASWDLAFHAVTLAAIDPVFAQNQLLLLTREWFMHPNGQLPAYEYSFSDANPPVQAWAVMRVYEAQVNDDGHGDLDFLERAFQKLLVNFTWWTNRLDDDGRKLFGGGFLGMDNISAFNRSTQMPKGVRLTQVDGNAWIGFFLSAMFEIALELAVSRPAYVDIAGMIADDYVKLARALNTMGGNGLWDDEDGFYFDVVTMEDGSHIPLKLRTAVGLSPLFAVFLVKKKGESIDNLKTRANWSLLHSPHLQGSIRAVPSTDPAMNEHYFASFVPEERFPRMLQRLLDEQEFLSAHGIRSLSRAYKERPFCLEIAGHQLKASYEPAEATDDVFGGNSNWRGPVWMPVNVLLIFSLERYGRILGSDFTVEFPTGSGRMLNLLQVADELRARLIGLFLPKEGGRPVHGRDPRYREDPLWEDLVLFYEYFSGDDGRGVGASHQTGWTGLVANLITRK